MKLYRVEWYDNNGMGQRLGWAATKKDARQMQREVRESYEGRDQVLSTSGNLVPHGVPEVTYERVDVPTDRDGLVRWLNNHLDSDNG